MNLHKARDKQAERKANKKGSPQAAFFVIT
jgi:hypothetical protein